MATITQNPNDTNPVTGPSGDRNENRNNLLTTIVILVIVALAALFYSTYTKLWDVAKNDVGVRALNQNFVMMNEEMEPASATLESSTVATD